MKQIVRYGEELVFESDKNEDIETVFSLIEEQFKHVMQPVLIEIIDRAEPEYLSLEKVFRENYYGGKILWEKVKDKSIPLGDKIKYPFCDIASHNPVLEFKTVPEISCAIGYTDIDFIREFIEAGFKILYQDHI